MSKSDTHEVHSAARQRDLSVLERLLTKDKGLVHRRDQWDYTPLHFAATADVAQLLLKHGADPNAAGWMGATPLHRAAEDGRADVLELLIRKT